jgi:5-(carboxyamino)imidazole ribonucleotide synthase
MQQTTIGILGGGQLGRMLIQASINYDLTIHVLDNDSQAPCRGLCHHFELGSLQDYETVLRFGQQCDLLTVEIESVNARALETLVQQGKKVYPQPHLIHLIQDKIQQKKFYKKHGIPTSNFIELSGKDDLMQHLDRLPAVQKLARDGYDGRGVQILRSEADLHKAFDAPSLLEDLVDIEREISVIVARNERGAVKSYPAVESVFHPEANLVDYLFTPSKLNKEQEKNAEAIARMVIERLGLVGILAVEMFLTKDGQIWVNEIAPRPHNSGHPSIEANQTSQFEQHLRAILNLPLGSTHLVIPAVMVNLLGEEGHEGPVYYEGLESVLAIPGIHVHLYGKRQTKPFRKMGHVTIIDENEERLLEKMETVKQILKVKSRG